MIPRVLPVILLLALTASARADWCETPPAQRSRCEAVRCAVQWNCHWPNAGTAPDALCQRLGRQYAACQRKGKP